MTESKKTKRKFTRLPLDRQKTKANGEFFGRPFSHETPTDENGQIVYSVQKSDFTLNYRFNKAEAVRLKKLLKLDKEFSLGRRASKLWYSMIVFAAEQGTGTSGTFSIGDVVKLWDCEKSGRLYADIKQTFMSLATFNPVFTNNKAGKNQEIWGWPFFRSYRIKGDGDGTVFEYTLNEEALGVTSEWLKDKNLSVEALDSGYLSLPIAELKEKDVDAKYENFRERLRLLKGGMVEVKFETILSDWIKLSADNLRRRKWCHDLVIESLNTAKERGEIKDFKLELRGLKNWRNDWKVKIQK